MRGLGKERVLGTYQIRWFALHNRGELRSGTITTVSHTAVSGDDDDDGSNNSAPTLIPSARPIRED